MITSSVENDLKWWQSQIPAGWTVFGWSHRNTASIRSPNGRHIEIDARLLKELNDTIWPGAPE